MMIRSTTLSLEAAVSYDRDHMFRLWAASHGGIYVPVDATTVAAQGMKNVPETIVTTPSGRRLMLLSPAQVLSEAYATQGRDDAPTGKITSLNPINPENAPDGWEHNALLAFERGEQQVSEIGEN
ncbi:MAG: DUF3365 domain-containing protein [Anaerolineales bacterium]|nr:DUF3365 domain-containing protein [Anaerolineales bacterium]